MQIFFSGWESFRLVHGLYGHRSAPVASSTYQTFLKNPHQLGQFMSQGIATRIVFVKMPFISRPSFILSIWPKYLSILFWILITTSFNTQRGLKMLFLDFQIARPLISDIEPSSVFFLLSSVALHIFDNFDVFHHPLTDCGSLLCFRKSQKHFVPSGNRTQSC